MSVPTNGRYGCWAGRPSGQAEDKSCCQEQVFPAGRGEMHRQCDRAWKVERNGQRFCKQHDPEAVQAKRDERERQWKLSAAYADKKLARERASSEIVKAAMAWHKDGHGLDDLRVACAKLELLAW